MKIVYLSLIIILLFVTLVKISDSKKIEELISNFTSNFLLAEITIGLN
jgi:hypothetical protein